MGATMIRVRVALALLALTGLCFVALGRGPAKGPFQNEQVRICR